MNNLTGNLNQATIVTGDLDLAGTYTINQPLDVPGGSLTLRFTINNVHSDADLDDIAFDDDHETALPGGAASRLVAAGGLDPAPLVDPCGPCADRRGAKQGRSRGGPNWWVQRLRTR